jgi:DNA recombination protein RmuC
MNSTTWALVLLTITAGFSLGLAAAFVFRLLHNKTAKELAQDLFRENETQRQAYVEAVIDSVKESFGSLSLDALSKSTDAVVKLAQQELSKERQAGSAEINEKKGLIDQELARISGELEKVSRLINQLEKDREHKFGELSSQLKTTNEQTRDLAQTTHLLREALASSTVRGQWGERMAEDVLRLAGFIENINYLKQKTIDGGGSRPDFTFLLPKDLKLHMDVKFPLDNYLRFLESESESEKAKCRNDFLRDVRARIREITTRDYIDPEHNTVDYVLLFIPNEQIYAFIHEQDSSILDDGIRSKVVFCSPITLFAVLAVIRQAVDNFSLQQTSNETLSLLGTFKRQWEEFISRFEVLGRRLEDATKEYESLTTVRRRQLEKPLQRIDELRTQRGLPLAPEDETSLSAVGRGQS